MTRRRSASITWALATAASSIVVACTLGPTTSSFGHDDSSVPDLSVDAGVAPACVNLECDRSSCPQGHHTTVSGTVYDPAGQLPLYNAIVYVPNAPVEPFPKGVSCDHCGTLASGNPIAVALTNEEGRFSLVDVPAIDNLPIVIQVGRWRRVISLDHVTACQETLIPAELTHLPRNHHEGDIPLYAVVTGAFDPLECLLRKIGIDDEEFTDGTGDGRVHLYRGWNGGGVKSSQDSLALYPQLDRYDDVLLACEGETYPQNKPYDATYAMLRYLDQGGRAYASHFQYYWFAPFPDGAGVPPLPSVAVWDQRAALNEGVYALVDTGFPKGIAYKNWLTHAGALGADGIMIVDQARKDVLSAVPGISQSWLHTDMRHGDPRALEILTFNTPVYAPPGSQCGRVVFSDMHVASDDVTGQIFPTGCVTKGLTSQEKALEFMIFDLSSCVQEDAIPPVPPSVPLK